MTLSTNVQNPRLLVLYNVSFLKGVVYEQNIWYKRAKAETRINLREAMETLPLLPEDIIVNMLSILSVKYLIQLKVCIEAMVFFDLWFEGCCSQIFLCYFWKFYQNNSFFSFVYFIQSGSRNKSIYLIGCKISLVLTSFLWTNEISKWNCISIGSDLVLYIA